MPEDEEDTDTSLNNGNFIAGQSYSFNLVIDGEVIGIDCTFTGQGETVSGKDVGHFLNQKTGTTFKWTKKGALSAMPVAWDTPKEEF